MSLEYNAKKIDDLIYEIPPDKDYGMNVPVKILADESLLRKMMSEKTIMQAINASTLPGTLKHVVVLPDGHQGYGFPVGGIAAMDKDDGVISPGSVGYDINCGVRLIKTDLDESQVRPLLKQLIDELFNSIPSGLRPKKGCIEATPSELDEILSRGINWCVDKGYAYPSDMDVCEENGCMNSADPHMISSRAHKRGQPQVGSIGSGNHFLEIQRVDEILDREAARKMGIENEGQVTILIHCGSRGLGHQVCTDYLKVCEESYGRYNIDLKDKQLACVPFESEEGQSYKKAMHASMNFAWCNRQLITHYTRKSFSSVFNQNPEDLGMDLVYDVAHNVAKIEDHKIDGTTKSVLVHRKGATRAYPKGKNELPSKYRDIGQPIFIPGSMGTASWILLGGSNSMDLTFGSTAHGAGRVMSRTKSHKTYDYRNILNELESKKIIIKSMTRTGIVEEAPQVYKNVDQIANISHDLGLASKVVRLTPIGVIKG